MPSYTNGQHRFKFQRLCVKKNMDSETQNILRGFRTHLENADMNVNAAVRTRCVPKAQRDRTI
jgi:hypothetical protein